MGRAALLWTIGIFTAGIGLLYLPFYRRCQFCGHNKWMNRHQVPTGYGQNVGAI